MSSSRPKLGLKPGAPPRDPRRPGVRPGAPRSPLPPRPREEEAPRPQKPAPARAPRRDDRPPMPEARPPRPAPAPPAAPPAQAGIRLSKHLSDSGQASRREADDWIAAGWVRVDGQMAVLGQRVQPGQRVEIDPIARQAQAEQVTVLLHKPLGFVSGQAEDGHQPAVVLVTEANHWAEDHANKRFHPGHVRGLAPAGRLDLDSTGLLVLTQDGRIARLLIGDESPIEKEYLVEVRPLPGGPHPQAVERLRHGLWLDERPLLPAKVSWQSERHLRFVLHEGRKRQIRRMCELVGLGVVSLKRLRIGRIGLGQLPPGQWRYLGPHERF